MNTKQAKSLKLATLLAATMLAMPYVSAQSSDSDTPPDASTQSKNKHGHLKKHDQVRKSDGGKQWNDVITSEERQELAKARKQALEQNPALQQNITSAEQALQAAHKQMKDAQDAVTSAMKQADPNVAAILEKLDAARKRREAAERQVEQNPQLKAEEQEVRQLRHKLLEQTDPSVFNDDNITEPAQQPPQDGTSPQ